LEYVGQLTHPTYFQGCQDPNYYYYYYYNHYYYYYKCTDYSDVSLKLQGHFTYQIFKKTTVDSNQNSIVRQLKQMGLCLPPKRQQATLICAGRLFHARASATGKARSPRVTRRVG